jgi:hypothetical protein
VIFNWYAMAHSGDVKGPYVCHGSLREGQKETEKIYINKNVTVRVFLIENL